MWDARAALRKQAMARLRTGANQTSMNAWLSELLNAALA
jgi:hypothetical protein